MHGRKILVTGASGYLGSWMAERARREGANVRILLRSVPPYLQKWSEQFEVVLGNVTDRGTLAAACRNRELIWHTASVNETETNTEVAFRVNVLGTDNIAECAASEGVARLIKFSTFHVYGAPSGQTITEQTPAAPRSLYGLTNFLSEECGRYAARKADMEFVAARISNGYGAPLFRETNRWTLVINDLVRMAAERQEIVLKSSGVQTRDFVSIGDIYQAIRLLSVSSLQYDTFNVGGQTTKSILDIANLIQGAYESRHGKKIAIRAPKPAEESGAAVQFDTGRLLDLGYKPDDHLFAEIERTFDLLEN